MNDYYKILEITDEEKKLTGKAFNDAVSKHYKKLSLKWHPDRWVNGTEEEKKTAEEKFKEISEAKSVLTDENKRRQYDMGSNDNGFGGAGDIYEDLFRNMNPFGGFRQQRVKKGGNIEVTVTVSLKEAFSGGQKTIPVPTEKKCEHCNGTGSEDGKTHVCPHCHGTGQQINSHQNGNMFFQNITICPHCNGTGNIINNPCTECHGSGVKTEYSAMTIDIPKGVDNGIVMPIRGKGKIIEDGIPGDLLIHFNVTEDKYFERSDGCNLIHTEEIKFNKALLGLDLECDTIDGEKITVKIPECTQDGKYFIIKGKGMPDINNPAVRGDMAIVIKYKYPKKLSNSQRDKLKSF